MSLDQLFLRCFMKKEGSAWVAVCVDLNLAAQAESLEDAKLKLESMIATYVKEAFTEDKEYSNQLLTRTAPASIMLQYFFAWLVTKLRKMRITASLKDDSRLFRETLPLTVA